ncbi:MAG: restriction endonuclease subunit S [Nostoc sp.]|uniref:restriction endonuclease subunit S n=1 Tax=Nostoc sp. TaxID=1180 RepID=UPI002FF65EA9
MKKSLNHGLEGLRDDTAGIEGYKKTEVGVIPDDWKAEKLGELFKFKNGVNAEKKYYGKGIKFINILEVIQKSSLFYEDIPGFISLDSGTIKKNIVQKGDVLFNRTSETQEEIGLTSVYLDDKEVVFGGFVIRARPISDSIDYYFSKYGFSSVIVRNQIIKKGQGAVRANIGQSDLKEVCIPLPPLPEQKAIAQSLSDVDALITECDRIITKKRNTKQGTMQQLLTGKKRLPGFSGEWQVSEINIPEGYKKTEYGLIPIDWEDKTIGDLVSFSGGSQPPRSTFLFEQKQGYIRLIQIRDYKTDEFKTYIPEYLARKKCSVDDIMIGRYGPPIFQILKGIEGAYNVALIKAAPIGSLNKKYLYYFLKQESLLKFVEGLSQRSSGQTGIEMDALKDYPFPVPSDAEEQKAIAQILSDMDTEIAALEQKRDKYKAIKQGMMQELLIGKTRLKI